MSKISWIEPVLTKAMSNAGNKLFFLYLHKRYSKIISMYLELDVILSLRLILRHFFFEPTSFIPLRRKRKTDGEADSYDGYEIP